MRAARLFALVVFAAAVVAFVAYVWTLDPDTPYTPPYPSTTLAPAAP